MSEESLAAEYYALKAKESAIADRLAVIKTELTRTTGDRTAGAWAIKVSSFNMERLDSEAAKAILLGAGLKVPMTASPSVRLTVKPLVLA